MIRRPPRSTRTDTLFPYTTLFRSKTGIRGKGGQMLKFAELETLPDTRHLHCTGYLDSGERVVVSFGPEHGALEQKQVELAMREAGDLFPRPKRSAERRVGNERVSTCRSRWTQSHKQTKTDQHN